MRLGAVFLVTLAACGRFGFDEPRRGGEPDAPDGSTPAPPGDVDVRVTIADGAAGIPVDGAYVVAVAQDGSTDITRTDASGHARTFVPGATTFHIAFQFSEGMLPVTSTDPWRVVSYYEVGGGTTLHAVTPFSFYSQASSTVNVPVDGSSTSYTVTAPLRCELETTSSTPAVAVSFNPACAGAAVPLLARSDTRWLDGGIRTLTDGGSSTITGAWQPLRTRTVRMAGRSFAAAQELSVLTERAGEPVEIGTSYGAMTTHVIDTADLPVDRLRFVVLEDAAVAAGLIGHIAAPVEAQGEIVVDLAAFPPSIAPLTVASDHRSAQWSYAGAIDAGMVMSTVLEFELANAQEVFWSAYAPAARTSYTVPALPPPLDHLVPQGATTMFGVLLIDLDTSSYLETLSTIDRELFPSASAAALFPYGVRMALRLAMEPGGP